MKVLVLEASGPVGFAVAKALSRAGNLVYGQIPSADKAKVLEAEEILPIVSESISQKWLAYVQTIDAVVDATDITTDTSEQADKRFQALLKEARVTRSQYVSKLTFIHTSATWLHGDNSGEVVSETTPINPTTDVALKWRVAHEQVVLRGSEYVQGVVIRPSVIYGHGGSLMEAWLREAAEAKKKHRKMLVGGARGGRLALIHLDDLAELYSLVVEKVHLCAGQVFDASNDFTESTDDILAKIKHVVGIEKGWEYHGPKTVLERAMACSAHVRPHAARRLLDWRPRKPGFVDGLAIYHAAALARADHYVEKVRIEQVIVRESDETEIKSLKATLHTKDTEIKSFIATLHVKETEIISLKSELHEKEVCTQKVETELSSIKVQVRELEVSKSSYEKEIREFKFSISQKDTELSSLRHSVRSSKEEFLRAESELREVQVSLKRKEIEFEESISEIKVKHKTELSSHTQAEVRKLREELRIVKETTASSAERVKFLEAEVKRIFERYQKCTSGIRDEFRSLLHIDGSENGYLNGHSK